MRHLLIIAAALAAFTHPAEASSVVHVQHDPGGVISVRLDQIAMANARGDTFVIDGLCASACTLYLTADRVCVTPRADLRFHGSWHHGRMSREGNRAVSAAYRSHSPALARWFQREAAWRGPSDGFATMSPRQAVSAGYVAYCR